MKLSKKNCKVTTSEGPQYTIYVLRSNKQIGNIVEKLGEQFNHVELTTECCHDEESNQDHCVKGTEITASRSKSGRNDEEQHQKDTALVLGIINDADKTPKRPFLPEVRQCRDLQP